ncbi:unnamed protein product, partial [Rotaria magnacalcarata]
FNEVRVTVINGDELHGAGIEVVYTLAKWFRDISFISKMKISTVWYSTIEGYVYDDQNS